MVIHGLFTIIIIMMCLILTSYFEIIDVWWNSSILNSKHNTLPCLLNCLNLVWNDIDSLLTLIVLFLPYQYVTEKMGVAEGTKLTDEYMEMEKVRICTCILYIFDVTLNDHESWFDFDLVENGWSNWIGRWIIEQDERISATESSNKSKIDDWIQGSE